jgi:hypothetical protein
LQQRIWHQQRRVQFALALGPLLLGTRAGGSCRGSAASVPRVQRQGAKTGGRVKKPILGRNSGTDLAPMHCSNYSLGIVRAASGATIFELCKSDILQIRHPPNQTSSKSSILQTNISKSDILQIRHPPNQTSSKSSILQTKHPPNHASSLHPTIVWPFPSRGS